MSPHPHTPPLSAANRAIAQHFLADHAPPGEVVLCAIVGSRLYGYATPTSDLDLKGIHQAPTARILQLFPGRDSHERITSYRGRECDLTTHELATALRLLLKGNGNMLERIASPLQLVDHPAVDHLRALARATLSRRIHGHYRGYFRGMQREHDRDGRAKPLLASIRLALTGTHMLQAGEVECDLNTLADHFDHPEVLELAAFQRANTHSAPPPPDLARAVKGLWPHLEAGIAAALETSPLPPQPDNQHILDEWLVRRRLEQVGR